MPLKKRESFRWSQHILIHEAGHAVAGYLLGYQIKNIKIKRHYQGKKAMQGAVNYKNVRVPKNICPPGFIMYVTKPVRRTIMHTFAGEVAEVFFFDKSRYRGGDWIGIAEFLRSYCRHKDLATQYFRRLHRETVDWFMRPKYMNAVSKLAWALWAKPNMQGREVRKIIRTLGLKPLKKWSSHKLGTKKNSHGWKASS